uniref:IRG-type G domain-containing protein n=1 Tax=Panagrolaimus superbus TaxID=310955 RepID=A0A914ZBV3_9BILA
MGLWGFFKSVVTAPVKIVKKTAEVVKAVANKAKEVAEAIIKCIEETAELLAELVKPPGIIIGRPEEAIAAAIRLHNIVPSNAYHFGFAGPAKAGKSSLLNSIRGLQNFEDGAAKALNTECTYNVTKYPWKEMENVILVDLPGCGTRQFPSASYFINTGLGAFECIIILVEKTLRADETALAKLSKSINQPVCFVRSKMDQDLRDAVMNEGQYLEGQERSDENIENAIRNQANARHLTKKIKDAFMEEKAKNGLSDIPVFCISATATLLWLFKDPSKIKTVFEEKELLQFMKNQVVQNRSR